MNGSKLPATFFVTSNTIETEKETQKVVLKGENTLEDVHSTNLFDDDDKPKYNRNKTLSDLKELRKYANVNIRQLDKEIVEKFYSILKTQRLLKNEQTLMEMFSNDVKKIFGDLKNALPGTPGALFMKCDGSFECDPSCETSIFKGNNNCNMRVLHYCTATGQFNNLNEIKNSEVCVIYVDVKKNAFKGFNSNDIQLLSSHGCNKYIMIYNGYDNKVSLDQYPITPIHELPKNSNDPMNNNIEKILGNIENKVNNSQLVKSVQQTITGGPSHYSICLAIIILIILILCSIFYLA